MKDAPKGLPSREKYAQLSPLEKKEFLSELPPKELALFLQALQEPTPPPKIAPVAAPVAPIQEKTIPKIEGPKKSIPQELYRIKSKDSESGPFTFKQLQNMWNNGQITADATYLNEDSQEWNRLLNLADKLENRPDKMNLSDSGSQKQGSRPDSQNGFSRVFISLAIILGAIFLVIGISKVVINVKNNRQELQKQEADRAKTNAWLQAAIIELRKVDSVVTAGTNYPDYEKRVLDAKVAIDADLVNFPAGFQKINIEDALEAYIAARDFWQYCLVHGNPQIHLLTDFPEEEQAKYTKYNIPFTKEGYSNPDGVAIIWNYASGKTNEAGR